MLKPYYIKADTNYVQVILAYQYFSVLMNGSVYHFVPKESREIKINRKTKRIVNVEAKFAFQKGKDIIYISMTDLISLPDFLIQLHFIVESYYAQSVLKEKDSLNAPEDVDELIETLERENVKRLIDEALDNRDKKAFKKLVKYL